MPKFITDWKKIGQSGPTIDGRTIQAEWLEQAAESYDLDVYSALIWPDHFKWFNAGIVRELKAVREGDVVSLYAKIQPNDRLLDLNKEKQKLFTSMELQLDFADTGKAYLVGLAVTDIPASLGTTELEFSAGKDNPNGRVSCSLEFSLQLPGDEPKDPAEEEIPGWFKRLFMKATGQPPQRNPEPEEEEMNEKQFAELNGNLEKLNEGVSTLVGHFSKPEGGADQAPSTDDKPEGGEAMSEQQLAALNENMGKLLEGFSTLQKDLAKAPHNFTQTNDSTGAAGEQKGVV